MCNEDPISLIVSFQDLPDPRVEGRCDHNLIDIIVIAVCAVISGAESWVDVVFEKLAIVNGLASFMECGVMSF